MKALIIGAGIGGLTTALQLHSAGIEVEVFDSVSELRELGVGINLQPYATRELAKLNLLEPLQQVSVITPNLQFHSKDGKLILHEARGLNAGYQYPQLSIHRGKLHMVLLDAFNQQIGNHKLHLSHHFKKYTEKDNTITAEFIDYKSGENKPTFSGDLLIGADGIHSMVRKQLHPNEGPMQFEGIMMWRGTTYTKPYLDGKTVLACGNPLVQLIVYPVSDVNKEGLALINWVIEIQFPEKTKFSEEDWSRVGNINDFINHFSDWDLGFLDIHKLFNNAEKILEYPMVDREPLSFWSKGRITLLGDAAHPMYPRGGNGASQAIVDASVIRDMLQQYNDVELALKEYEKIRIPVTSQVVRNNRQSTQSQLFELIEKNCKQQCGAVHRCVDEQVMRNITHTIKQNAGATIEQVNK